MVCSSQAQINPYHLNGNARQENCNCYTITPDLNTQSGSLWNINKISLEEEFSFNFNVFLGCSDAGADGIVFVLQPLSTSVGSSGGGLGYEGVSPSIGIAIDTYTNGENNDPVWDHISIHRDGDIRHNSPNNLAGPEMVLNGYGNIEDCNWHTLSISWNPLTKTLKAGIDGIERVSVVLDLVAEVFNNDPMVFWGFTGSTGGAKNHQRVCTSLNPGISIAPDQITCFPEPILFRDSSVSFGSIKEWNWDFGDGSTFSGKEPPPHRYPRPGVYEVKLSILGNDGCVSEPFRQTIVAGSKPQAAFAVPSGPICENDPLQFVDNSQVEFGSISAWSWNYGIENFNTQNAQLVASAGAKNISLQVRTKEGCVSDISRAGFEVFNRPVIDMQINEACAGMPASFEAQARPQDQIAVWNWNLSNGEDFHSRRFGYTFLDAGEYSIGLQALSRDGCPSELINRSFTIHGTRANAGADTVVAANQPLQLFGSGGTSFSWSPATGLSDPTIANPMAILTGDMSYILTAASPQGCASSDTIHIKVFKGPAFHIPNVFSPNGDGRNDRFEFIAAGISELEYFQIYNRYGQLIYSSNNLRASWDGRLNGKDQSSGTYVYAIAGKDYNGNRHTKKGSFILVR